MNENTTIWIKRDTHNQLKAMCPKWQTYDDFINELIKEHKKYHSSSVMESEK